MKSFEKDLHRYVRNALNRSITKIAKEQRELIKLDYALSNKKIRNLTKISRAKQDKLEATIANAKVALSINNFKRFQNKQGVRVKIAKNKTLFFIFLLFLNSSCTFITLFLLTIGNTSILSTHLVRPILT